jgi:hypothetical protein
MCKPSTGFAGPREMKPRLLIPPLTCELAN